MSADELSADTRKRLEQERKEIERALDETIEDTIRTAALPNSVAWIGVVGASFAINLLVLLVVTGG